VVTIYKWNGAELALQATSWLSCAFTAQNFVKFWYYMEERGQRHVKAALTTRKELSSTY
jgi:hypothetical protein